MMDKACTWYIDSTFKVVGKPFYQMTSFHVFYNDKLTKVRTQIGCVVVLMSRRCMTDYMLVVEAILDLIPVKDLQVKCIMMDFEASMWQAMSQLKAEENGLPANLALRDVG